MEKLKTKFVNSSATNTLVDTYFYNKCFGGILCILIAIAVIVFLYTNFVLFFSTTNTTTRSNSFIEPIDLTYNHNYNYKETDYHDNFNESNVEFRRNPYGFDKACRNFTKRLFNIGYFNLTALVSFPGSGNTWLRHLIELSTGIYTGSIYFDLDLISKGFAGEKEIWTSGTTIVQKSHQAYRTNSRFKKAVLLIRDPYQSIISFVQYLEVGHTGYTTGHIFRKKGWENYVLGQTYKWIELLKSWIESPISILIVHYENLKQNSTAGLRDICNFLGVKCSNLGTTCFKNHEEGNFHRKKKLRIAPPFPNWVREKVDDGIEYLNMILQSKLNQSLPLNKYPNYNLNRTKIVE